jgi:uncharacterized delta-60 repeat protein
MRPALPPNLVDETLQVGSRVNRVDTETRSPVKSDRFVVEITAAGFADESTGEMQSNVVRPYSSITVHEVVVELDEPSDTDTVVDVIVGDQARITKTVPAGKTRCGDSFTEPTLISPTDSVQIVSLADQSLTVKLVGESQTTHTVPLVLEPAEVFDTGEDINPGPLRIGKVNDITVDADGKYLVVGSFTSACQQTVSNVARINSDGTLDTTFNTGGNPTVELTKVVVQPDGKILVGNMVSFAARTITWGDRTFPGLVRLNADGSLDTTWMAAGNPPTTALRGWELLADGNVITTIPARSSTDLARYQLLDSNGNFVRLIGPLPRNDNVRNVQELNFAQSISETELLLWGHNTVQFGRFGIYDLTTESFNMIMDNTGDGSLLGEMRQSSQIPKRLLSGDWVTPVSFLNFGDLSIPGGVLRVAADLSSWEHFTAYKQSTDARSLDVDESGRIVLGGWQIHVDGDFVGSVVRLDATGVLDTTFDASQSISPQQSSNQGTSRRVDKVFVLPDGKILVGGNFTTPVVEGRVDRRNFIRLNSNGTVDTTFPAI